MSNQIQKSEVTIDDEPGELKVYNIKTTVFIFFLQITITNTFPIWSSMELVKWDSRIQALPLIKYHESALSHLSFDLPVSFHFYLFSHCSFL